MCTCMNMYIYIYIYIHTYIHANNIWDMIFYQNNARFIQIYT